MKKIISQILFVITLCFLSTMVTYASVTPNLSLYSTGNGDSVQLNVTGDPNSSVIFYYLKNGSGQQIMSLGTTDINGNFSTVLSTSSYNIVSNSPVHITIGGINGPSSSVIMWPVTNSGTNQFSLNQTGVVLSVGQSSIITANNTSGTIYVANNSNPQVASVNINSSQITIYGLVQGSSTVTICTVGNTTNCPSIYVTVQNSGAQTLTFGQSNITLSQGQNFPVSITGGTGAYTVLNNSNPSLVTTSINGSTITLSTSGTSGSASVTVCSTDMSSCGIINISIGSSGAGYLTFSQTNPTIATGQTQSIAIYGGTNASYYVSSSSNPNVAQVTFSGSTMNVYGVTTGSTTLNICASSGGCGQIVISVSYASNGGTITLSQSTLNILTGQTLSITISGGTAPYSLPIPSSSMYQSSISGNILTFTGLSSGNSQVAVCSSSSGCTWLNLIVNGASITTNTTSYTTNQTNTYLTISNINPTLAVGQNLPLTISGGQGSGYTVAYNSNSNVASTSINSNILSVTGIRNGYSVVVVCDGLGDCGFTGIAVGISNISIGNNIVTTATTSGNQNINHNFTQNLYVGYMGADVAILQNVLTNLGFYSGPINGHFGPLTEAGVKRYQAAHGISQTGTVGPITRASLNAH